MAENKEIDEMAITENESGVFHIEDEHIEEEGESPDGKVVILEAEQEQFGTSSVGAATAKEQETNKWEEKYLYLRADFENYKKRAQKDQLDQSKFANEKLLKEALVVMDNLERAILHFNGSRDFEKVSEGLSLVLKQFGSFLTRFGVSPVESLNKPFDPACHQAVGQVDRADLPEGEVAEEVQKGYRLFDRLIRPSFVMISKKSSVPSYPSEATEENSSSIGGTVDVGV